MQFGVQFFPAVDHTDKSAADYFAESLAIAEEADTLGFTHARTVEHYFTRYGGYGSPETFTDGLVVATWVGAAVVGVGALVALVVPGRRRRDEVPVEEHESVPQLEAA